MPNSIMPKKLSVPFLRKKTSWAGEPMKGRLLFYILGAFIPVIWAIVLSVHIIHHGTPGFRLTPTNDSFVINTIDAPINTFREGDRIKRVFGLSYHHFLGYIFFQQQPVGHSRKAIIERDGAQLSIPIQFEKIGWATLLKDLWPNYLLIVTLIICSLTAVLLSPPEQPASSFFMALTACAMIIASQISFDLGQLHPMIMSASFILLAIGNWVMFSAWAHYCFNFPVDRQLLVGRPWAITAIYLLPPIVSVVAAYIASGPSMDFWGGIQRFRRWHVPFIIFAAYGKHVSDYYMTRSKVVKNQLRIPLIATWFGLGPYVFLYLLPSLLWGYPLITFRLVVLGGLSLPLAFLYVMIRYRLLEIDEALSTSLAYFILIITLYFFYAVLLSFFNRVVGFQAQHIIFPLLVLVVFFLNPIRSRIQFTIDRFLFPNRIDVTRLLQPFSRRLTTVMKIDDLAALLTGDLRQTFKVEKVAIEVIKKGWRRTFSSESAPERLPRSAGVLLHYLENIRSDLSIYQSQSDSKLAAAIADIYGLGYVLILGLKSGRNLVGVLFLGLKQNNRVYTEREIRVFKTLSNQAALALENTLIYEALTESRSRIHNMYKKLIRSEKLANIGEMASMLAHEIKNPLAIIRSSAQYLVSKPRDHKTHQELLEYIVDEADTLNLVFSNMLGLSGYNKPTFERFDLINMMNIMLNRWESGHDHRPDVTIVRQYSVDPLTIVGDKKQLSQLLVNLIRNSEEAFTDAGFIFIQAAETQRKNSVKIFIKDTGMGIAKENAAHLFRKFFTTKDKGLGLGLSLCRQIIQAHSGTLNLKNNSDEGATVTVVLPKKQKSSMNENVAPAEANNVG